MIKGRDFVLKIGMGDGPETFQTIGALRATSFEVNNSTIDVSTKDTLAGYTKLFPGGAIKTMSISGDGIYDESSASIARLRSVLMSTNPAANFRFVVGDGNRYVGEFQVTSFSEDGPHDGVVSYRISLQNTQDVTYEAGS